MPIPAPRLTLQDLALVCSSEIDGQIERVALPTADRAGAQFAELLGVLEPSYEDAKSLLIQEYHRNNVLYIRRLDDGRIGSFFMVGWLSLELGGDTLHTVFLGLSAARDHVKAKGGTGPLYRQFLRDGRAWEEREAKSLILWCHSATPIAVSALWKIFDDTAPRIDGTYSEHAAVTISRIARAHTLDRHVDPSHPFVLRAVATARYSSKERDRLASLPSTDAQRLFEQLRLSETSGDRLLMLARIPRWPRASGEGHSGARV